MADEAWRSKLPGYILPIFPAVALIGGVAATAGTVGARLDITAAITTGMAVRNIT